MRLAPCPQPVIERNELRIPSRRSGECGGVETVAQALAAAGDMTDAEPATTVVAQIVLILRIFVIPSLSANPRFQQPYGRDEEPIAILLREQPFRLDGLRSDDRRPGGRLPDRAIPSGTLPV